MKLVHLDDPSTRNQALVSGQRIVHGGPTADVEQRLLAELRDASPDLLPGLLAGDEASCLEWIVARLQRMTGAAFALVGELTGEDWDRVRTIELRTPGGRGENFEYDLLGTPCARVVGQVACIYPMHVAELFPDDELLAQMGVESYIGVPLFDEGGRPLGIAVLLDQQEWPDARLHQNLDLMLAFRSRLEALLINRRMRRDLELLAEQLERGGDLEPLTHLVLRFAHSMNVSCAFVASPTGVAERMRAVAIAANGRPREAVEFARVELPELPSNGELLIREQLERRCPAASRIAGFQAAACLLLSLEGPDGRVIGTLGLVHDRPLNRQIGEQPVVRAFRGQIAFELHRSLREADRAATERRLLELQRTEGLGILAGGIAHDFNNLLVGVLGNAELALADLGSGTESERDAAVLESVVDIRDAAHAAMQLCRQMLAYAGRAAVESKRFDLGAELRELSRLLTASISRRIELVVDTGDAPLWVDGDIVQIRQVVMNLITNAGDAIGDAPGHIWVSLTQLDSGEGPQAISGVTGTLAPGRYVCLSVRDDGCGMDEATTARIFDPFFTTKPHGHGLGLAAMLGIVRGHSGTLTVSSRPGAGSSLNVYLPLAQAADERDDTGAGEAAEAAGPRSAGCVLVVDDEPRVRKVAKRMLERSNYVVLTAGDGLEALEVYARERERIDCVVLDLGMPKLGGIETIQQLRAIDPELPLIVSSGYSKQAQLDAVAGDGRCVVVHKPYELGMLLDAVSRMITGESS